MARQWWLRFLLVLVVASAIDKGANWALANVALEPTARLVVALLPLPGNLALIFVILGRIRSLDEFQKRIHFEAVVVGFLGTGVAVFIHDYLRKAQVVGPPSAGWVWAFMAFSYAIGYVIAIRQYR
jgi:hypothetical protein